MKNFSLAFALMGALFLGACKDEQANGAIKNLAPAAFAEAMKGAQLLDVRSAAEFAEGHLQGAKLIPHDQIASRLAELDKSKPVALYCRVGRRSGMAADVLSQAGFADIRHLDGGVVAWQAAGQPIEK